MQGTSELKGFAQGTILGSLVVLGFEYMNVFLWNKTSTTDSPQRTQLASIASMQSYSGVYLVVEVTESLQACCRIVMV